MAAIAPPNVPSQEPVEIQRLLGEICAGAREASLMATNAALEAAAVGARGSGTVALAVRGLSDRAAAFGESLRAHMGAGLHQPPPLVRTLARDVALVVDEATSLAAELLEEVREPFPVMEVEAECRRLMDCIEARSEALDRLFGCLPPARESRHAHA